MTVIFVVSTTILLTQLTTTRTKSPKSRPGQLQTSSPTKDGSTSQQPPQGYLVYVCDWGQACGGWGDRHRAIVNVYMLAYLTHRHFRLVMTSPCDVTRFYVPHRVDWRVKGRELEVGGDDDQVTFNLRSLFNIFLTKSFHDSLRSGDFNAKHPQRVVYFKGNHVFYDSIKSNSFYKAKLKRWKSYAEMFKWAWGQLMQPSQELVERLEAHVGPEILVRRGLISKSVLPPSANYSHSQPTDSPLICAHVRVGKNPNNPKDIKLPRFSASDLPLLINFLKEKDVHGDARFFIASDSEEIRAKFRHPLGSSRMLEAVGRISHIDLDRHEAGACEGLGVALLEQLVLSVCDQLVVTPSGYSFYAALVSNSSVPPVRLYGGKLEADVRQRSWPL